jgi:hypothetical protein
MPIEMVRKLSAVQHSKEGLLATGKVSTQGLDPMMEAKMFTTLMKSGSFRVDYLNRQRMGFDQAVGLYILGDLTPGETYSRSAKRALYRGFMLVREQLGIDNLVGVYVDVDCPEQSGRLAYQVMKRDIKSGMFRKVLVQSLDDLFDDADSFADWWRFYRELARCEILTMESGEIKPAPVLYWPVDPRPDLERNILCKAQ